MYVETKDFSSPSKEADKINKVQTEHIVYWSKLNMEETIANKIRHCNVDADLVQN